MKKNVLYSFILRLKEFTMYVCKVIYWYYYAYLTFLFWYLMQYWPNFKKKINKFKMCYSTFIVASSSFGVWSFFFYFFVWHQMQVVRNTIWFFEEVDSTTCNYEVKRNSFILYLAWHWFQIYTVLNHSKFICLMCIFVVCWCLLGKWHHSLVTSFIVKNIYNKICDNLFFQKAFQI